MVDACMTSTDQTWPMREPSDRWARDQAVWEDTMKRGEGRGVIEIPKGVWETAETKEDIEDWLLTRNPKLVRQLRRIRRHEDLAGRGQTLRDVARRWNIKL